MIEVDLLKIRKKTDPYIPITTDQFVDGIKSLKGIREEQEIMDAAISFLLLNDILSKGAYSMSYPTNNLMCELMNAAHRRWRIICHKVFEGRGLDMFEEFVKNKSPETYKIWRNL